MMAKRREPAWRLLTGVLILVLLLLCLLPPLAAASTEDAQGLEEAQRLQSMRLIIYILIAIVSVALVLYLLLMRKRNYDRFQ